MTSAAAPACRAVVRVRYGAARFAQGLPLVTVIYKQSVRPQTGGEAGLPGVSALGPALFTHPAETRRCAALPRPPGSLQRSP